MKIPKRTCIGCYQVMAKKDLIRLIIKNDNSIMIDLKANNKGRGTYVCRNENCINRAIRTERLNRAFRISLNSTIKIDSCAIEHTKKNLLAIL
ncbi:TPA: YlxR family protein [bacterium]|nr:YlxR family protein [bacterium]